MKAISIPLLTAMLLTISCEKGPPLETMVGTWKTLEKDGQSITMVLMEDHTASLSEGNITVISDSLYESVLWNINSDVDPIQLDIASTNNGTERISKMIVRFLSEDKIEIRYPDGSGNRPTQFEDYNELQQIFKRQ